MFWKERFSAVADRVDVAEETKRFAKQATEEMNSIEHESQVE